MPRFAPQAPSSVIMIRPHHFSPNPETAADNAFQVSDGSDLDPTVAQTAYDEVTRMADRLAAAGVTVHLFEDTGTRTPDSVFPNNWISTHAGGHVALYPMYNENRRRERRADIVEMLKTRYRVQDVIDYSGLEQDNVFLEGTGAMVLDHIGRVAYAARSNRTNEVALERFCTHFNFEPMQFTASDAARRSIYHTNVLMSIGTGIALVGLDCIENPVRRDEVCQRLAETGRRIIPLSQDQVANFAGNAMELYGSHGPFLAMSRRASSVLTPAQQTAIENHMPILSLPVPTIELAGGSVRCMMAGIHLSPRAMPAGKNQDPPDIPYCTPSRA